MAAEEKGNVFLKCLRCSKGLRGQRCSGLKLSARVQGSRTPFTLTSQHGRRGSEDGGRKEEREREREKEWGRGKVGGGEGARDRERERERESRVLRNDTP
jgi:hypothetical protein